MWEFYLVCAELAFSHGSAMVFQMQMARQRDIVPLTRDYIFEAERAYIESEQTQPPTDDRAPPHCSPAVVDLSRPLCVAAEAGANRSGREPTGLYESRNLCESPFR